MQKKILAVAIASALTVPMAAEAVTVKFSGHVNRATRFADDGVSSDVQHVSHGGSRSRLRWRGSEKFGNGNTAGIYVEMGFASNRSFSLAMKAADGGDSVGDIRHSALWFGGKWGTLWLGHTGNASYIMESRDLSGLSAIMPNGSFLMNGASSMRAKGTHAAVTTVGAISHTFDTGREDVIKYVSPWLGPVQVEVSHSNNDTYNAMVNLKSSFGGGSFLASVGYESGENRSKGVNSAATPIQIAAGQDPNAGFDTYGGSASFKFSQGTSITAAYMERDRNRGGRDSNYWTAMLAHSWGNNKVGLKYYAGDDMALKGDSSEEWSIGFMHTIPKVNVQLYATYNNLAYDTPGVSVKDMDLVMVGSRIFF